MSGRYLLVAFALISAGLAGCIGSSSQDDLPYASFDDAMAADGKVVEPADADSSVRLKLLEPAADGAETGKTDVTFVLYEGEEPITDAEATIDAHMPAMGHGTSPEEDPTHRSDGIYVGRTNLMMAGNWVINLNVSLADGTELAFEAPVAVGADGGMSGNHSTPASFDSFEEAMQAPGEEFAPDTGWLINETSNSGSFAAAVPVEQVQSWSHEFDVAEADGAEVVVTGSMEPGSDVDELTYSIRDPSGQEQESLTLTAGDQENASVTFEPSTAGTWSVNVTGQAADVSFSATVQVKAPVGDDVRLKTLDPADPSKAKQDKQPFVVLLYDKAAKEPITDAEMTLSSYMPSMGHGTDGEVDPTHQGDGIYEGKTNLIMGGEWTINVTATRDDGAQFEWILEATV